MVQHHSNGLPNDGFVELADMCGIAATEDVAHGVVMLQFFDRGVALLLTYGEVLTLGVVIGKVVEHVKAR